MTVRFKNTQGMDADLYFAIKDTCSLNECSRKVHRGNVLACSSGSLELAVTRS